MSDRKTSALSSVPHPPTDRGSDGRAGGPLRAVDDTPWHPSHGVDAASRPRQRQPAASRGVNLSLPLQLHQAVAAARQETGRTRSDLILSCVELLGPGPHDVPKPRRGGPKQRSTLYVPADELVGLDRLVERSGTNRAHLIAFAVFTRLDEVRRQPPAEENSPY